MYTGILKILILVAVKKFISEYLLYVTFNFINTCIVFLWTLSYYYKHNSFLYGISFHIFHYISL